MAKYKYVAGIPMTRKPKSSFSGLCMLSGLLAFNTFSETLSLVLMRQELNKTEGCCFQSQADMPYLLAPGEGVVTEGTT